MGLCGSSWSKNQSRCWAKERGAGPWSARLGMVRFCCWSLRESRACLAGESAAVRSARSLMGLLASLLHPPREEPLRFLNRELFEFSQYLTSLLPLGAALNAFSNRRRHTGDRGSLE